MYWPSLVEYVPSAPFLYSTQKPVSLVELSFHRRSIRELETAVQPLFQQREYTEALCKLAALQAPVDAFFDEVMVMADDTRLRDNRLALLNSLSQLFLQVADISLLQK